MLIDGGQWNNVLAHNFCFLDPDSQSKLLASLGESVSISCRRFSTVLSRSASSAALCLSGLMQNMLVYKLGPIVAIFAILLLHSASNLGIRSTPRICIESIDSDGLRFKAILVSQFMWHCECWFIDLGRWLWETDLCVHSYVTAGARKRYTAECLHCLCVGMTRVLEQYSLGICVQEATPSTHPQRLSRMDTHAAIDTSD